MKLDTSKVEDCHLNFIEEIIEADLDSSKISNGIHTRFPPEPNGYLHIGHAKSICINFELAKKYNGLTNLRFDDTNPCKEETEYVNSILEDVRWLGFEWAGKERYASDYFQFLYNYAEYLIQADKAYVCDLTEDDIKDYRGNFFKPGINSPFRNRSISENLALFRGMRTGQFEDGSKVLRAKIDMQHPNMNMRDPIMYRIRRIYHHRTGYDWPIYPMYDYAHCVSDAIEQVTHSICTLEFEDHRLLYEWFLNQDVDNKFFSRPLPRQIEFARLNLSYTIMSKRLLLALVENKYVTGWDDPRMPTIAGLRRRGYTPDSIKSFINEVSVAKRNMVADIDLLESCVRNDLDFKAKRVMGVLRPLKLIIDNMSEDATYWLDLPNHPKDRALGFRQVPLSRELYIDRDDFNELPPKNWFRLTVGVEVRLKNACLLRCVDVVKDASGAVIEVHCVWDPESLGGNARDGRKVNGTLHWVSAAHAIKAEVRLYSRLFNDKNAMDTLNDENWASKLNANNVEIIHNAYIEATACNHELHEYFQFERVGYFVLDPESKLDAPIYNRTVELKSSWGKKQ